MFPHHHLPRLFSMMGGAERWAGFAPSGPGHPPLDSNVHTELRTTILEEIKLLPQS